MERVIFHVDVNNAYLSWTAVRKLKDGEKLDIRKIPAVIGGDEKSRHGIVLAKSPVAKKFGIKTAETLYSARKKCPNLKVFPAEFSWYSKQSNLMFEYLSGYTPEIERFSIDECFMDLTGTNLLYKDLESLAYKIKDDIKNNFGFTVNVGIGNNKLCAKMASDFLKPDRVHTLYMGEIPSKMWILDVSRLFMVGKKTAQVLKSVNINTIGDLAKADDNLLKRLFKNQASFLKNSARGIDNSKVSSRSGKNESVSMTATLPYDYDDPVKLKEILFSQTEEVTRSLRSKNSYASVVAVTYKNNNFISSSHQRKLEVPSNNTIDIYKEVVSIFDNSYRGDAIRNIGVRLGDLVKSRTTQVSLFSEVEVNDKDDVMTTVVDNINRKYGNSSVIPASIKVIGKSNKHEKVK